MGFLLGGGAVAGGGWAKLVPVAAASVLLYAGGLVQNDLAHLPEDAQTRPERPLPSGAINIRSAWAALCGLVVTAMLVAGFVGQAATSHLAFGLVVLITLYNYSTSRIGLLGPINMGLCRAGSVLLGASAVGGWGGLNQWPVIFAAATIGLYVVAVTLLAMRETESADVGDLRWLPHRALIAGYAFTVISLTVWVEPLIDLWQVGVSAVFCLVGLAWGIYCGHRLKGMCEPSRIGRTIGMWVRALLVVQAALAALGGPEGVWFAVGLFAAWPLTGLLARRFASS